MIPWRYGIIDLKHLAYLTAVAEEGSITRAGQRLGIQQPPPTRQMRMLEQRVGVASSIGGRAAWS